MACNSPQPKCRVIHRCHYTNDSTLSLTTAVSPITMPVPWSMKTPSPMRAAGWMSICIMLVSFVEWNTHSRVEDGSRGEHKCTLACLPDPPSICPLRSPPPLPHRDTFMYTYMHASTHLKELVDLRLEVEGQGVPPRFPQPVRHPVGLQGLEALLLGVDLCLRVGMGAPSCVDTAGVHAYTHRYEK